MDTIPVSIESSSRKSVPVSVGALIVAAVGTVAGGLLYSRGGPVMVLILFWPTLASASGMIMPSPFHRDSRP